MKTTTTKKNSRVFMCDFETTVYKGQMMTEVWAAAAVEFFTEDVKIWNDISGLWEFLSGIQGNIIAYFHNLKFDGEFILHYLMKWCGFKPALDEQEVNGEKIVSWKDTKQMKNGEMRYAISNMGQWYNIICKVGGKLIEFRDSLKLLPFSVEEIGRSFKTKHRKLSMKYEGVRKAFGEITESEKQYITNDLLVPKEALEMLYNDGHTRLTIGSCCMQEWKKTIDKHDYKNWFPDLTEIKPDADIPFPDTDAYIRRGYHGGWTYVAPDKAGKLLKRGCTFDVNSLYPSVMHSDSKNKYPIGLPTFWKGDYIPEKAISGDKYYYLRIRTRFYLKPGYLPFIQIKHDYHYRATENLETSDYFINGKYYSHRQDGTPITVELTLSQTDYELVKEHYELVDMEILDGCYFYAMDGTELFDRYINTYSKIKQENTGAKRSEAKLFLNNLYGKLASSTDSSFKIAVLNEDGSIGYYIQKENNKKSGYIAIGAAITSYARAFTIRAAQQNYHPGKPGFCYADTDSIHCDLHPDDVVGVPVHPTAFNHWKLECEWQQAIFVRQKTYMELVNGVWDIKCAGMPKTCKTLFSRSLSGIRPAKKERDSLSEEKIKFLRIKREPTDFTYGLSVPGKLVPRHIPGGVLLTEISYTMK